jgi:hypothetical protein
MRNYLGYALGEVLLVVLGILIALQINNWNENRKAVNDEMKMLQNFVQDLKADSASFNQNKKTLNDINAIHQACFQVGVNGVDPSIIEKPTYIRRLLYYNPIARENDPFIASKISNEKVRKEVLIYFRYLNDMNDVYGELEDVVKNRIRPYLSDQYAHNLTTWFESKDIDSDQLIGISTLAQLSLEPDFQQLLFEASAKLDDSMTALDLLIQQNNILKSVIQEYLK